MRVLFTTVPLPGHLYPLVPLAWACWALGHDVLVATSDNFVPAATRSGLPVASCGPGADFVALAEHDTLAGDLAQRRYANGRVFARIAAGNLPGMRSLVDTWRPDLVVSERAEFAGPIAAEALPRAELHWGVGELAEYRAAASAELGVRSLPRPDWQLNPWPAAFRLPYAAGHQGIRHVPYNGDAHVPDWAWRSPPRRRVCLTFGTLLPRLGADAVADLVAPVLQALARRDVEIVVAVDDKVAASWPTLPGAVRHAGRMPLAQVLRSCVAAIHHGGQGTSLTALAAGVPQLVLPVFDDQLDNADAVVRAGAGIGLAAEETTPAAVIERFDELLGAPRFARGAARAAAEIAAQQTPVATAVWLEHRVAQWHAGTRLRPTG